MMEVINIMFALIRYAVFDTEIDKSIKPDSIYRNLPELYALSNSHDLAHIVSYALDKLGMLHKDEISNKFRKKQFTAIYRSERMSYELNRLCNTLEQNDIPFIALKGAFIRNFYCEQWLRTSCDIDILVHEQDFEDAINVIRDNLNYTVDSDKHYNDISLHSQSKLHLELHFNIQEDLEPLDRVLSKVWDNSKIYKNKNQYNMTNEFLMYYLIAHATYHFTSGCGVRPFIDFVVLSKSLDYNEDILLDMCKQADIGKFYSEFKNLALVWFGDKSHNKITIDMQNHILKAGVYGTLENRVAVEQIKMGGTGKNILNRIFMPYDTIKHKYHILKKHKWLTPIYEVRRWLSVIFDKSVNERSRKDLKFNLDNKNKDNEKLVNLLRNLEILDFK